MSSKHCPKFLVWLNSWYPSIRSQYKSVNRILCSLKLVFVCSMGGEWLTTVAEYGGLDIVKWREERTVQIRETLHWSAVPLTVIILWHAIDKRIIQTDISNGVWSVKQLSSLLSTHIYIISCIFHASQLCVALNTESSVVDLLLGQPPIFNTPILSNGTITRP